MYQEQIVRSHKWIHGCCLVGSLQEQRSSQVERLLERPCHRWLVRRLDMPQERHPLAEHNLVGLSIGQQDKQRQEHLRRWASAMCRPYGTKPMSLLEHPMLLQDSWLA